MDNARTRFPDDTGSAALSSRENSLAIYTNDALERVKQYARDEPVSFALWTFGIGFVLGWRLKPW